MTRSETLRKANDCVLGHRKEDYGAPEDNFGMIAELWSTYLGCRIEAKDVPVMMMYLKTARIKTGRGSSDCWVDIAGYAACGCEIATEGKAMSRARKPMMCEECRNEVH